jgi:hypothetical protein
MSVFNLAQKRSFPPLCAGAIDDSGFIPLFHLGLGLGMKIFGFGSEKSRFPALEKCLPYFSNPDLEENRYYLLDSKKLNNFLTPKVQFCKCPNRNFCIYSGQQYQTQTSCNFWSIQTTMPIVHTHFQLDIALPPGSR